MSRRASITPLGYALLGLLHQQPRSGYALRRVFEQTPMGGYSSSPGSIYPALKGLEQQRLIERRSASATKQHFVLTEKGRDLLEQWLTSPVDPEDVVRHLDLALLRFAFLSHRQNADLTDRFLAAVHEALRVHAKSLFGFLESDAGRGLPLQARLAVEHGLRTANASADWAADARVQLKDKVQPERKERTK